MCFSLQEIKMFWVTMFLMYRNTVYSVFSSPSFKKASMPKALKMTHKSCYNCSHKLRIRSFQLPYEFWKLYKHLLNFWKKTMLQKAGVLLRRISVQVPKGHSGWCTWRYPQMERILPVLALSMDCWLPGSLPSGVGSTFEKVARG